MLGMAWTSLQELMVESQGILKLVDDDAGSLKLAMVGEFTPWKVANVTDQPSSPPPLGIWLLSIYQHVTAEDQGWS